MSIHPTISFSFSPTCRSFTCCCCSSEDKDFYVYPKKNGSFKRSFSLSDKEINKSNERFEKIIVNKVKDLEIDRNRFFYRLKTEEWVQLNVTRENPLTQRRLNETLDSINKVLRSIHLD